MGAVRRDPDQASGPIGRSDILSHVADMTNELRKLARRTDATFLVYLLDMAHQEAVQQVARDAVAARSIASPSLKL